MNHLAPPSAEERFAQVFTHLGAVRAYARRRGSADPDGVAAETMTVAWRRLVDVPADDARPWLFATARNLLLADWRGQHGAPVADPEALEDIAARPRDVLEIDKVLVQALASLPYVDREALLLVAWEDLTPKLAAASLGISPAAFRVRLHRARGRCQRALAEHRGLDREIGRATPAPPLELEDS